MASSSTKAPTPIPISVQDPAPAPAPSSSSTKVPTSVLKSITTLIPLLYRYNSDPLSADIYSDLPADLTGLIDSLSSLQNIVTAYQDHPEISPDETRLLKCLKELESKLKIPLEGRGTLRMRPWPLEEREGKGSLDQIECWKKEEGLQVITVPENLPDLSNEAVRNQIFSAAITDIRSQTKEREELAIKTLLWLAKGRTVITVPQLQTAVSLVPGQYELHEPSIPSRETLLEVCSGLATIDALDDRIRLFHYSLPAYLIDHSIVTADADATIAIACLTYLSFPAFNRASGIGSEHLEARRAVYPFFTYASLYLPGHLAAASAYEQATVDALMTFFSNSASIQCYLEAQLSRGGRYTNIGPNYLSPLQLACNELAHLTAAKRLLEDGADVYSEGYRNARTPLHLAMHNKRKDRRDFVTLLLDNGASLLVNRGSEITALYLAAHYGCEDVVRLLFERFPAKDLLEKDGAKSIFFAAHNGCEGVVRVLLENGAKPDTCEREFEEPEGWMRNQSRLASHCDEDNTPLHVVAYVGQRPSLVALLLQYGADVNRVNGRGFTALHYVAERELETNSQQVQAIREILKVLLENGAGVDMVDKAGRTPLSFAAGSGWVSIAEDLLVGGADPGIVDERGRTAREWAEVGGYKEVVEAIESQIRDSWWGESPDISVFL